MKTRRILAASTAALLAFGTTAAYVASADAAVPSAAGELAVDDIIYKDVKISLKDGVDLTKTVADAAAATGATFTDTFVVKGTAMTITAAKTTKDATEEKNAAITELTGDNKAKVSVNESGVTVTFSYFGASKDNKSSEILKVSETFPITDYEGTSANVRDTAGSDVVLTSGLSVKVAKGTTAKDFDKYLIKGSYPETADAKDYVDVKNTEAVKGLKDDVKDEIANMKSAEVAVINIDLTKDGFKEKETPNGNKVTVKVLTNFKPMYVYHVVDKEVELIRRVEEQKQTEGGLWQTTFNTTKFSPFILTTTKIDNAGVQDDEVDPDAIESGSSKPATSAGTSAAASNAGTSTTNPDTGIALAIAPVVLAAGAVAVVALKKKH